MAILFGTSSPNTRVKYDKMIVIMITKIVSSSDVDINDIFKHTTATYTKAFYYFCVKYT